MNQDGFVVQHVSTEILMRIVHLNQDTQFSALSSQSGSKERGFGPQLLLFLNMNRNELKSTSTSSQLAQPS